MSMLILDMPSEDVGFLNHSISQPLALSSIFMQSMPTQEVSLNLERPLPSRLVTVEETEFGINVKVIKKVKKSSQEHQAGATDSDLAKMYCKALSEQSPQTHIVFSKDRLEERNTGGTCTAMTGEFVKDYLKEKQKVSFEIVSGVIRKKTPLSPIELFGQIEDKYKTSSEYFRTIQATFNTIHEDEEAQLNDLDYMEAKINAMMRFYDLQVTDSSELFYMPINSTHECRKEAVAKIEAFMNLHQEGVFIIRCINPNSDSDKGEAYGHTTALIRDQGESYFYDPNEGVYDLPNGSQAIYDVLTPMTQRWAVPNARIYKVG